MIVDTIMCLHNLIYENDALDEDFQGCDQDLDYLSIILTRYRRHVPQNASCTSTTAPSTRNMNRLCDDLVKAIRQSR
jgi:hypothetical protein